MTSNFRWAVAADYDELGRVMFDAVRSGDSPYCEFERAAWVAAPRSGGEWARRLSRQDIIVAEENGAIAGFMSLAASGYVDFAYIRPAARGRALFRALYECIEEKARRGGVRRLWVHASLMAQPAFKAVGFTVLRAEDVTLNGATLRRFEMEKPL